MRQVVGVAGPSGRGVREQHVDRPTVPATPAPDVIAQAPGAPGLLPFGVLIRAGAIAEAAAEPRDAEAPGVEDAPVGTERAGRPRRRGRKASPGHQARPALPVAREVGIMVARNED